MARAGKRPAARLPRIQSLVRANAILQAIASAPMGSARLTDIQRSTGLKKTTVHTLLETLVALGFVAHDRDRNYQLGLRILQLGRLAESNIDLALIARPALIRLCQQTRETVNLALPGATDALVISSLVERHGVRATSYTGWRVYYHASALGKSMLAHFDPLHRKAILDTVPLASLTENTIVEPASLEQALERIRRDGFAIDLEEAEVGSRAVAVPIIGAEGHVFGAISVSGAVNRLSLQKLKSFAALIREEIGGIVTELQ